MSGIIITGRDIRSSRCGFWITYVSTKPFRDTNAASLVDLKKTLELLKESFNYKKEQKGNKIWLTDVVPKIALTMYMLLSTFFKIGTAILYNDRILGQAAVAACSTHSIIHHALTWKDQHIGCQI